MALHASVVWGPGTALSVNGAWLCSESPSSVQSGGQRHYTGTMDAWGKIYREEGGKAFFKVRPRGKLSSAPAHSYRRPSVVAPL